MQIASFTSNFIVQLVHCSILSSPQMGWSSVQACSAMADLSVKPLMHASSDVFESMPSLADAHAFPQVHFVDICLFSPWGVGGGGVQQKERKTVLYNTMMPDFSTYRMQTHSVQRTNFVDSSDYYQNASKVSYRLKSKSWSTFRTFHFTSYRIMHSRWVVCVLQQYRNVPLLYYFNQLQVHM